MNKKYLIDEEKLSSAQKAIGNIIDAKEAEVLDDVEGVLNAYQNGNILFFHDYLKANNLLIVKIIE